MLHMIGALCFDRLSSGQYHVYRGVLSLEGRGLLAIYLTSVDQLEKRGIMPRSESNISRTSIEDVIKEVG